MNIDYREKYLKYKIKYLELKQNVDNKYTKEYKTKEEIAKAKSQAEELVAKFKDFVNTRIEDDIWTMKQQQKLLKQHIESMEILAMGENKNARDTLNRTYRFIMDFRSSIQSDTPQFIKHLTELNDAIKKLGKIKQEVDRMNNLINDTKK